MGISGHGTWKIFELPAFAATRDVIDVPQFARRRAPKGIYGPTEVNDRVDVAGNGTGEIFELPAFAASWNVKRMSQSSCRSTPEHVHSFGIVDYRVGFTRYR